MKDKEKTQKGEDKDLKKLNIQGDVYYTRFTRKFENRKVWSQPNSKEVISFIPGTVLELLVKDGDTVAAEQKLLVLEAMKMKNTIYSPMTGKIKSVKIAIGDCIPKGTIMLEFE
jgi:biotin carboxyl carrier protein